MKIHKPREPILLAHMKKLNVTDKSHMLGPVLGIQVHQKMEGGHGNAGADIPFHKPLQISDFHGFRLGQVREHHFDLG